MPGENCPPKIETTAFCDLPFTKLIINGTGEVSMCCYQLEQLGKLTEDETLLTIWNSHKATQIRNATMERRLHRVCTSWNNCPFQVMEKNDKKFLVHEDLKFPTYLEICLPNTHCNIGGELPSDENPACIMCCRNYDFKPQPNLTNEFCEKAKPIMKYLNRLCILGIAEPFWKDAIFDALDHCGYHDYKDQITVETNTNITCLYPKNTDRWLETVEKSSISFSMDAASSETYKKIRRIDGFEHLVDHVKYYIQKRDEFGGADQHKAIIYNNINILNVHEMEHMVEIAVDCEVDQIVMIPTHDQSGRVNMGELLMNPKNVDIFAKNAELAMKRSHQLGMWLVYAAPFDIVKKPKVDLVQLTF
jgi:hypothetical protein